MEEARSMPPPPPALVKNPSSRRMAFDVSSHRSTLTDSSIDRRHRPCFFACCAWSCFVLFFLTIVFLFIGISYLAFLRAGMPNVNVRTFNVTKLQVDDGSQKMNAIIGLGLMFSNKNERLKLLYGTLSVDVTSEDVLLGRTKLRRFFQRPMNETTLDMTMTLENADVDKYAADELKSDINAYEMVFDVYVGGKIGFQVGSLQMNNVPFLVSCHQIKRMDVDFGRRPPCDVKMFAFRPSTN